jgi:hypothetical protein
MVRALNFPRRYGNLTQCGALPNEHRFERIDALRSSPWNRPTEKLAGASFGFVSGLGEAKSIRRVPRSAARLRATRPINSTRPIKSIEARHWSRY